jgi:rod shape-determining protein MreD
MKVNLHLVFFGLCMLIDALVGILFPSDFAFTTLVYIPQITLAALILSAREMNLTQGLLLALGLGMLYDFTHFGVGFMMTIAYVTTILVLFVWSKHMSESIYELVILVVVGVFVKELVFYGLLSFTGEVRMGLTTWLGRREFLTILGNLPLILLCIYLNGMKEEFLSRQERIKRSNEKVRWMNVDR